MSKIIFTFGSLAVVALGLAVQPARATVLQAAYIVRPTNATFSRSALAAATRGIDNSGLSPNLNTLDPIPVVYPNHGNVGHPSDSSLVNTTGSTFAPFTMSFDMGAIYTLSSTNSIHLWNYNETLALYRGIRTADIYYTDLGASLGTATGWQLAVSGASFSVASGLTTYKGADYTYLNNITARFIRFDVTDSLRTLLGQTDGANYTGISEIRFMTQEIVVPEPSTLALAGLGIMGLAIRRRRARR